MEKAALEHRSPALPITLVFLAFMFIMAVVSVKMASAYIPDCNTSEYRVNYWADPSHTTLVGGWRSTCECTVESWGTKTGYLTNQTFPCL